MACWTIDGYKKWYQPETEKRSIWKLGVSTTGEMRIMKETSREKGINSHYRKVSEVDLINLGRLPLTSSPA